MDRFGSTTEQPMYPRTRNPRENWNAHADATLSALVGISLTFVLVPLVVFYLASHPALGGGLLLVIGISSLVYRLNGRVASADQHSTNEAAPEVPVWFAGLDQRNRTTTRSGAD